MAINSTFYLDAADLATATSVYLDSSLLYIAPDGFYRDGIIVREQSLGILLAQANCPSCEGGLHFGQISPGFDEGEGDCFTVPFMNIYISGLPCDISNGDIACNTNNILDTFDGLNEYYTVYKSLCPTETYTYVVQINNFGVITVIENCIPPPP